MNENPELKPCPFCGGEGSICNDWDFVKNQPRYPYRYGIECKECLSSTDHYETEEAAIESWNRRYDNG